MNNKFDVDKLNVLEFLYKKFCIEEAGNDVKKDYSVSIFYDEIISLQMNPEEFAEVLHFMERKGILKITDPYDEEAVDRSRHDIEEREQSCFIVLVLSNFLEIYKELKKNFSKKVKLDSKGKNKKELQGRERSDGDKTFPHKIPAGTSWETVIIKFLNEKRVRILVQGFDHETDYKAMNMEDRRSSKPDTQWALLRILSRYKDGLTIKDSDANTTFKKTKQLLSDKLKRYFTIDYDPFFPYRSSSYKEGNSYKTRMTLIPSPEEKNREKEITIEEEINEFLREETPQVYDM